MHVKKLEDDNIFEVRDSYTIQTGLGISEKDFNVTNSLKLSDWSIATAQAIKEAISEGEKRWLHIDDDTTVLNKYNSESAIVELWRTRVMPLSRG